MDIMTAIKELLPELTKTQVRIANYILDNPDEICFSSLKKLAEEIGVTETTIINFCKKTEYESYAGIKTAMRNYLQDRLLWNSKLESTSAVYDADDEMVEKLKRNQKEILESSIENISSGELFDFVDTLSTAEHIYICAHSASLLIARNFYDKLRSTGASVSVVDVNDYTDVLDMLTHRKAADVFILITLPYYSVQTVAISDYLASVDATILAMTDKITSPIARNAKQVLLFNTKHVIFHNTSSALIAAGDIIAGLYILQNKEKFNRYNESVKEIEEFFQTATLPAFDNEYFYQQ